MRSSEPADSDAGTGHDETEPIIYLVVKGYGRGLRVFKVPPTGGDSQ